MKSPHLLRNSIWLTFVFIFIRFSFMGWLKMRSHRLQIFSFSRQPAQKILTHHRHLFRLLNSEKLELHELQADGGGMTTFTTTLNSHWQIAIRCRTWKHDRNFDGSTRNLQNAIFLIFLKRIFFCFHDVMTFFPPLFPLFHTHNRDLPAISSAHCKFAGDM